MALIEPAGLAQVEVTETSWTPMGELSFDEWRAAGRELQRMGRCWQWWVGDWILFGERHYGAMYSDAIELTGMEYSTLAHAVSVSRSVQSCRRRQLLSWSHHAEVAPFEPDDQTAWLDRAEAEGMTVARLRAAIKKDRAADAEPDPVPDLDYVCSLKFIIRADDDIDATQRLNDLAALLEKRGATITDRSAREL